MRRGKPARAANRAIPALVPWLGVVMGLAGAHPRAPMPKPSTPSVSARPAPVELAIGLARAEVDTLDLQLD